MKGLLELYRDAYWQRVQLADFDCDYDKEGHYRRCAEHIERLIDEIEQEEKREHK